MSGGNGSQESGGGYTRASPTEIAFWETIRSSENPEDFQACLNRYPKGAFAELAKIRLEARRKRPLNDCREAASIHFNGLPPLFPSDTYPSLSNLTHIKIHRFVDNFVDISSKYNATRL